MQLHNYAIQIAWLGEKPWQIMKLYNIIILLLRYGQICINDSNLAQKNDPAQNDFEHKNRFLNGAFFLPKETWAQVTM